MAQVDGAIDVSHVCKLTRAARKQEVVDHSARAMELYERALAAAEALRQSDCLIVALLRCGSMGRQRDVIVATLSGGDCDDAKRRVVAHQVLALFQAHLPGVLDTLERRRAAGTLLPGRCRAHEVAWKAYCAHTTTFLLGEACPGEGSISEASQLVGVAAYFAAALRAILALQISLAGGVVPDEQLRGRCLTFLKHALQLELERRHGHKVRTVITTDEMLFLDNFRKRLLPHLEPSKPCYTRLLAAWRDVEDSGLLQALPMEQTYKHSACIMKSLADAQAAKKAGMPLRACALPSCGAREAHVGHFKRCSACGSVVYCSKAHQAEHWPAHKAACKAARKAASQAAAEGGASQEPQ